MTKLEKKLKELGYDLESIKFLVEENYIKIYKKVFIYACIYIYVSPEKYSWEVKPTCEKIIRQNQIDEIQHAFDVMQKDLEELKLCQD